MAIDKSGYVYVTGYTVVTGLDYDMFTVKYNSAGIFQWARTYAGRAKSDDEPVGIEVDDSGNVFVGGSSVDTAGSIDFILIKYNSKGDSLFVRRFNNTHHAYARAMCMDVGGNIFIAGDGKSCTTCETGYMTAKISGNGILQWFRFYTGAAFGSDILRDITTDSAGNAYITGMVQGTLGTVTIKYNALGDSLWVRQSLNGGDLLRINSGKLFLLEVNRRILQYDLDGNLNWTRNAYGRYYDMQVDDSNNVYITGVADGPSAVVQKFSSTSDSIWQRQFQAVPNSNNVPNSLAFDSSFRIFVTGYTTYNSPWNRLMTVSYNRSGEFKWSVFYNNNTPFLQHEGVKVGTDKFGNIFVAGNSQGFNSGYDIAILRYSKITEVIKTSVHTPKDFKLLQNYPNPFNSETTIKYEVPVRSDITLVINDVSGKEVFRLTNPDHPSGIFSFQFSAAALSSGVYFVSLIADNRLISSRKLDSIK